MRALLGFLLCVFVSSGVAADDYDYGEPEEMRGVNRIYVNAGTDVDFRRMIQNTIAKKLKGVEVVQERNDGDLVLMFFWRSGGGGYSGELLVLKASGDRLRLLDKKRHFEEELDDLVIELAGAFTKTYKKHNN